jgi:5-deoxy-D-glucuronate isomerase
MRGSYRWAPQHLHDVGIDTLTPSMSVEVIEHDGTTYAEILWAETQVETTKFFSPPESSFQFGLLAHGAGYVEEPHYHKAVPRTIDDLQQMFVVQRGVVDVLLYTDDGSLHREVRLGAGDAIVLIHGVHAIRVVEDFQAISVKQGPFLGDEEDKVEVQAG